MLLGAVGISLDIFFSQGDLFFLYPSDPWLGPTTDTVIDGIVVVNLAVAQRVGVLKIALVRYRQAAYADGLLMLTHRYHMLRSAHRRSTFLTERTPASSSRRRRP
jgi:hypothetical protein